MTTPYDTIKNAIIGNPPQLNKKPSRQGVVKAFAEMQRQLEGAQAGAIVRDTLANLQTLATVPYANIMAWVTNDPVAANNGIYQNTGTASAPVWTRRTSIPQFLITANNVGAGTPNAIKATTDLPIPTEDGRALIALPIVATNTDGAVTVEFNGDGVLHQIKTNSGNNPAIGGLTGVAFGFKYGSTFRLLTDQVSEAIVAEVEALKTATETARDEALAAAGAAGGASPAATRAALKALPAAAGKVAILTEGVPAAHGRFGTFVFDASNLTSSVDGGQVSFAFDAATDELTHSTGHGLTLGNAVFRITGIHGMTSNTLYWVIPVSNTKIKLASSLENARAGIAIDITGTGSGVAIRKANDPLEGIYIVPNGKRLDGSEGAWVRQFTGRLNVCWWGARGTDSSDFSVANHAAFEAVHNFFVVRGLRENAVYAPAGTYRFFDEVKWYSPSNPRIDIHLYGDGPASTRLLADFYGAGKTLIKARDPLNASRCSPRLFTGLYIGTVSRSGPNPKLLEAWGWGTSACTDVFFGPCNNTQVSFAGIQDVYLTNTHFYFGGKGYRYKNTDALTFTVTGTGTDRTLTASAAIFTSTPNDVGKVIVTVPTDGSTRIMWEIIAVAGDGLSATVRCLVGAANMTSGKAYFQPSVVTANGVGDNLFFAHPTTPMLTADDVGRIVYIDGAKAGATGRDFLRGRIASVTAGLNGFRVVDELGNPVNADYAGTFEFATPVVDIYYDTGITPINTISTNNEFIGFNINDYNGLALGIIGQNQFKILSCVFEGNIGALSSEALPAGQIWGSNLRGFMQGSLGTHGGFFKDYSKFRSQTLTFDMRGIEFRNFVGENRLVHMHAVTGPGNIQVTAPTILNEQTSHLTGFLDDNGTNSRLLVNGMTSMGNKDPRYYLGWGHYVAQGGIVPALVGASSVPNRGIAVSDSSQDLVWRDNAGTIRTLFDVP